MNRVQLFLLTLLASFATQAFDEQSLVAILETERVKRGMPGLRAAVRFSDAEVVRAATGFANPEIGQRLDDTIGMPGGSTGKTFVAALTLQLANDGLLDLEDPVAKWLGDHDWYQRLPNAGTMKVRHLLSHSSGLKDYPATFAFQRKLAWRVLRHGSGYFTPEELIEMVADRSPLFPAGEGYRYSDAGYLVLGRVIEAAAGKPFYPLLNEHVLAPMQLDQIRPQTESVLSGTAWSASLTRNGSTKFDPRSEWTGGGLITNPTMLLRFFAALEQDRPDDLRQMLAGGWRDPKQTDWHYGYGLFVQSDGSSYGHGGLWPGYRTHVTHFAHRGLTIAVQTNRDGRVDLPGLVALIEQAIPEQARSSPTEASLGPARRAQIGSQKNGPDDNNQQRTEHEDYALRSGRVAL